MIRRGVALIFLLLGLAGPIFALEPDDVDHLMGRVAFGAEPADYSRFASLSRTQAVDLLLEQSLADRSQPALPDWAAYPWQLAYWTYKPISSDWRVQRAWAWNEFPRWYLNHLLVSRAPLRERMTLFWHEFYPNAQVDMVPAWIRQDRMFRRAALGNYVDLLRRFSRDSLNGRNLDLFLNRRGQVNENFGRELLELYSLGPGHYSQTDVIEVSRAFTGWRTLRRTGWFFHWWPWHDFGRKTVLGQQGRFDGDDVIDILAAQPRFAEFLVERLWREFVSPEPDHRVIADLSSQFRKDYQISTLLRAVLKTPQFWAPENRKVLVKSPVELIVSSLRSLSIQGDHGRILGLWSKAMGQRLFIAPDVKGWRGYTDWISVGSLEVRDLFVSGVHQGFDQGSLERLPQLVKMDETYTPTQYRQDMDRLAMAIEHSPVVAERTRNDRRTLLMQHLK